MRCSRSSDDQFDDYDGELQHLVVHHGGGHQAEGGGGVSYLTHMFLAPTGSQGARYIIYSWICVCECVTNAPIDSYSLRALMMVQEISRDSLREERKSLINAQKSLKEGS